jgi:hypothetical protein
MDTSAKSVGLIMVDLAAQTYAQTAITSKRANSLNSMWSPFAKNKPVHHVQADFS